MELVVLRPGETLANAEGRYLGALDTALNDKRRIGLVLHKVLSDRRVGEAARGKCAKLALPSLPEHWVTGGKR